MQWGYNMLFANSQSPAPVQGSFLFIIWPEIANKYIIVKQTLRRWFLGRELFPQFLKFQRPRFMLLITFYTREMNTYQMKNAICNFITIVAGTIREKNPMCVIVLCWTPVEPFCR